MSLSRSHRRAVFGGAGISLAAALLVPALAQFHATKKAAAPITVAPASATSTHLVKVSDVIRDLQARIDRKQALVAGEPPKSAKEAEEEFHEETRNMLQRFRKSLHEKSGKAVAEAEEEHEGIAGTHAEQALLYRLVTRYSADDVVDPDAMLRAMQQRDTMKPAVVRASQPNAQAAAGQGDHSIRTNAIVPPTPGPPTIVPDPNAKWQLVGPRNGISQQYTGRVNAVAYDVRNPGRVFCGGAKGGVWKSNDYGTTWTPKTDYMAGLSISGITIDPNNSNVVYAGTGDYDAGGEFFGIPDSPFGLLKSTDAGETWSVTGRGLPTREPIHKILVDPRNSSIVYATCGFFGLYKSTDAGATWAGITIRFPDFDDSGNPLLDPITGLQIISTDGGRVSDIVFTSNQTELVVSTDAYNTRGGIYSSFNGGASWGINLGVSKKPLKTVGRFDVAASLSAASTIGANGQFFGAPGRYDPGTLYVIDGGAQQIYKRLYTLIVPATNQYGYLWTQVANPAGANWGQAFYDIYIAAGALDRIFVGLINFHISLDGGATFINGNPGHTDQHAISIVNLNQYILGNDGGAWLGTVIPSGTTATTQVQTLNQNLYLTQFYFGAYNPVNVNGFLGGAQDNSSPYTNDGANWPQVPTGDGGGSVINQDQPGTQYTSSYDARTFNATAPSIFPVFRTDDAWNTTFRDISVNVLDDNVPFLATIKANLADPSLIYLGTNFLWQYNANTNAWNQLTQEFTNNTRGAFVLSIGTAPQNKNVIYTGTTNGFVWYSQNGGQTFNNITANLSGAPVSSLFVSPTNPQKVYATIEGAPGRGRPHVFRCDNTNAPTWVSISSNLPDTFTNTLAIIPNTNEQQIYVGTDIGVFVSQDAGATWANATQPLGLPNAEVRDLTAVPGTNFLMASTFGRSVWRFPLTIPSAVVTVVPTLQGYRGDRSRLRYTVTSAAGGSSGNLTSAGTFTFRVPIGSTYNFYITITGFLNKRISGQFIAGNTTLTPIFINGDVNGDNVIDATDAAIVQSRLRPPGQRVFGLPDVDGDGIMTSNDLQIVQSNVGQRGD